jgi:adenylylsulfate kinase-like enzyme
VAKTNPNGNGTGATTAPAIIPTIHLVLQGKGGIGKSVVAGWLAEFLMGRGQPVRCIDGASVVTAKPAIEGHLKTGQRTAART